MDIRNSFKKYGKQFLKSASAYSKHKSVTKSKSTVPKQEVSQKETPMPSPNVTAIPELKPEPKLKHHNSVDYEKEFIKLFNQLTYSHRSLDVLHDFVTMFACAISNSLDKRNFDEREKLYLKTVNQYNKDQQMIFPELAATVVMALEQYPEQDFLGHIYMNLGLGNKSTSQFFTPYHICQLMAEVTMDNILKEIKEKGYISINDSCCGAGATLIAGIHEAKRQLEKENLNFQNHVLVVAQDIDFTVAMMCYIQISLLGVAGCVKVGNSLTEPIVTNDNTENYWFTPMYFSDVWQTRMALKRMKTLFEEK